jgi:hypothetical protein
VDADGDGSLAFEEFEVGILSKRGAEEHTSLSTGEEGLEHTQHIDKANVDAAARGSRVRQQLTLQEATVALRQHIEGSVYSGPGEMLREFKAFRFKTGSANNSVTAADFETGLQHMGIAVRAAPASARHSPASATTLLPSTPHAANTPRRSFAPSCAIPKDLAMDACHFRSRQLPPSGVAGDRAGVLRPPGRGRLGGDRLRRVRARGARHPGRRGAPCAYIRVLILRAAHLIKAGLRAARENNVFRQILFNFAAFITKIYRKPAL